MNLHLVDDEKFIDGAIDLFEKYAQNENVFLVNSTNNEFKYIKKVKEVRLLNFSSISIKKDIENIVVDNKITKIYIHFIDIQKAAIVNFLLKKFKLQVYWIFFGGDLYDLLYKKFNYPLYDMKIKKERISCYLLLRQQLSRIKFFYMFGYFPEKSVLKCIKNLHYFCFWNHFDYELLLKHIETKAEFLYFAYFNAIEKTTFSIRKFDGIEVVVNHSGALSGHHITLFEKISLLDKESKIKNIISPLSYGSATVINNIIQVGYKTFNDRFFPVVNFLDKKSYFDLFQNVSVAFYGAKRQEAAGNIFSLLGKGVKIFLRNDNNLLNFLRERGFIVFSFENDFNSIDDLESLTDAEKILNQSKCLDMFSLETEKKVMNHFVNV